MRASKVLGEAAALARAHAAFASPELIPQAQSDVMDADYLEPPPLLQHHNQLPDVVCHALIQHAGTPPEIAVFMQHARGTCLQEYISSRPLSKMQDLRSAVARPSRRSSPPR